jgi:hypothetical protein
LSERIIIIKYLCDYIQSMIQKYFKIAGIYGI